jgi:hypothetical protein
LEHEELNAVRGRLLGTVDGVVEPGGESGTVFTEPLVLQVPVNERLELFEGQIPDVSL